MKAQIFEALRVVIGEFQENPYAFLFEEDIRASLFYEIRKRIPEEMTVTGTGAPEQTYRLRRVYCEYAKKIDIACLKPYSKASLTRHKGTDTFIYNLPVEIGIELKYRKIGDRFSLRESIQDYSKLKDNDVTYCLALAFVQDENGLPDFLGSYVTEKPDWSRFIKKPDGIFIFTKTEILKMPA